MPKKCISGPCGGTGRAIYPFRHLLKTTLLFLTSLTGQGKNTFRGIRFPFYSAGIYL